MERLINIDNGGTLTDICVGSGSEFAFTKTLTTPVDLSQCLFDGMTKVSSVIYGEQNLSGLLHSTQHIRYSSTQGTNALVERKGPRLGLITDDAAIVNELRTDAESASLFDDLVGPRTSVVSDNLDADALTTTLVAEINRLTTAGAERLILAAKTKDREALFKRIILESFPRHLLGSVPVLFSWEFASDELRSRRIWSGIINSFLHPTVERFLYSAERRLRTYKIKNPLLIYRNDGASSRGREVRGTQDLFFRTSRRTRRHTRIGPSVRASPCADDRRRRNHHRRGDGEELCHRHRTPRPDRRYSRLLRAQ